MNEEANIHKTTGDREVEVQKSKEREMDNTVERRSDTDRHSGLLFTLNGGKPITQE